MITAKKSARPHHGMSTQYQKGTFSVPQRERLAFKSGFCAGACFSLVLIMAFVFMCLIPALQQVAGLS